MVKWWGAEAAELMVLSRGFHSSPDQQRKRCLIACKSSPLHVSSPHSSDFLSLGTAPGLLFSSTEHKTEPEVSVSEATVPIRILTDRQ